MSIILIRVLLAYLVNDPEYLAGDVSLQATDDFRFRLALFHSPQQISPGSDVIAKPDDHYSMNSGIRLAVATPVETITVSFA